MANERRGSLFVVALTLCAPACGCGETAKALAADGATDAGAFSGDCFGEGGVLRRQTP